jgi:hypothetical protein
VKSSGNLHSAVDLGEITVWHHLRRLEANANLETSWAPIHKLNGAFGLEGRNSGVHILGDDVSTVQHAGGHVLAVAGITLDHLVVGLEARHGDFLHGVGLVCGFGSGDNWSVGDEREMNAGIWHKVGLELVQIDVEGSIEAEGSSDGGNDCAIVSLRSVMLQTSKRTLCDETVQVLVVGALNAQVSAADVVDSLVVDHEGAVGVLKGCVRSKNGVVRLNHRGGNLRSGVHAKFELALLAIVNRQALHQQRTETRSGAATKGVEDEETLQAGAVVGNTSDFVQNLINELLSDSVVATSVVVGRVFLACNHLFGVEKAAVGTGADLVDNIGLEIGVDCARNVFALAWHGG